MEVGRFLDLLQRALTARGYLVLTSDGPLEIGRSFPGIDYCQEWQGERAKIHGELERGVAIDQPFAIIAQTDRADWDQQQAFFHGLDNNVDMRPRGTFFYRMVTD
jgi:hypothetical protein